MANEGLKHFDYLNEYAADLETDLGLSACRAISIIGDVREWTIPKWRSWDAGA